MLISRLEKYIHVLAWWTARVAQVALALTMLTIVTNVLLRIWWKPLPGTYELVEIFGAILLALGVAHCAAQKGHVAVGVLVEKFPKKLQALIDSVTSLIALFFAGAIAWETASYALRMMKRGYATAHLSISLHPVIFLVAFGILILALVLLLDLIKALISLKTR